MLNDLTEAMKALDGKKIQPGYPGTDSQRNRGPNSLTQLWLEEVGQQLICQIELYAYMAARFEYKDWFYNRGVIAWLDNESARFAASKGTAQSPSLTAMARVIQQLEVQHPTVLWVERLCFYSHPFDKPSRGQCAAAAKLFQATHDQQKVSLGEKTIKPVEALTKDLLLLVNDIY